MHLAKTTLSLLSLLLFMGATAETKTPKPKSSSITQRSDHYRFRLLATNKTSTMEKELNDVAGEGFRFVEMMGGETLGGSELVSIMERSALEERGYEYLVLATSKTGTMEKEMNQSAEDGFRYRGQTIYESSFGGQEVVVIMEKDLNLEDRYEYALLATKKTSTLEKELGDAGADGFYLTGLTIAQTLFGGEEVVAIMERSLH